MEQGTGNTSGMRRPMSTDNGQRLRIVIREVEREERGGERGGVKEQKGKNRQRDLQDRQDCSEMKRNSAFDY